MYCKSATPHRLYFLLHILQSNQWRNIFHSVCCRIRAFNQLAESNRLLPHWDWDVTSKVSHRGGSCQTRLYRSFHFRFRRKKGSTMAASNRRERIERRLSERSDHSRLSAAITRKTCPWPLRFCRTCDQAAYYHLQVADESQTRSSDTLPHLPPSS